MKLPRPRGQFQILQDSKLLKEDNLFTDYGVRRAYLHGKNTIISTTNGGVFTHCHLGNGTEEITNTSVGLSNPISSGTLTQVFLTYKTINGIRYAEAIFHWTFPAGIAEITELCMSDNADGLSGMLCGRSLEIPLPVDANEPVSIIYMIHLPIISQATGLEESTIIIDGVEYEFQLEGVFHIESPTTLETIFPYESPLIWTGNLSRMYINNTIVNNGSSAYECVISASGSSLEYSIMAKRVNADSSINIINIDMANSDPNSSAVVNFPIRAIFTPSVNKPVGLDFEVRFRLFMDFED